MILAWTKDKEGKSLLYERRTTTLPMHLEKMAHYSTALVLGDYYRTYPGLFTADAVQKVTLLTIFVQIRFSRLTNNAIFRQSLKDPEQYEPGPFNMSTSYDESVAHVVKDGGYISARWPGDAVVWSRVISEEAEKLGKNTT
jgi:hypothetical protein